MTPTQTRRRGRLYRYYVCLGRTVEATKPARCARSPPARWRDWLSGRCVGRSRRPNWSRGRSPRCAGRTAQLRTRAQGGRCHRSPRALEPVWDELYPAEQARILRLLIERIDVAPDGIAITLYAAGIRSLVAELADQEDPALAAFEPVLEAAK